MTLKKAKKRPMPGKVARATPGDPKFNTITLYEHRHTVIALGIQFSDEPLLKWIKNLVPDLTISGDTAEYISHDQHVRYTIEIVRTKQQFKTALETPGIHVVYSGHARRGRGPCFGLSAASGDNWEMGTDAGFTNTGIFRMGFPLIGIPIGADIKEHGYHFLPALSSVELNDDNCHPEIPLARSGKRGGPRPVAIPNDLKQKVLDQGQPVLEGENYWGFGSRDLNLLLVADWQNSLSTPMDLGSTDIQCKCASFLGCSTLKHWHPIVRVRKGFKQNGDDGFAYFIDRISDARVDPMWMANWFKYPERNDFESWEPSLEFCRARCNKALAAMGAGYLIKRDL